MKIERPNSIRIGGFTYAIEWVDGNWTASNGRYAETDLLGCEIRINASLSNARLADSFMHEITHAVIDWYGYTDDNQIGLEAVATTMGKCLPMVWRDNPGAFAWWSGLLLDS